MEQIITEALDHNTPLSEDRQGEALDMKAKSPVQPNGKKFYIESYGCAMNFSDSEIVASVLMSDGFQLTKDHTEADVVLFNTCSIRENAEDRIRARIKNFTRVKKPQGLLIGVLGCMAERLKHKLLEEEKLVDIVCGPDAYRSLPSLLKEAEGGQKAVNVLLSREETYAEISPVRLDNNGVLAYISIMRGCDNMCSFCVVPFTRGRERSRSASSIEAEARDLYQRGYRDVTLLGQNVDSYKWEDPETGEKVSFAQLLEIVAKVHPDLRVRFSTSHPKDMLDDVLHTMAAYENICKYVHLPVQSGNSRILEKMNRTYDRAWYLNRIEAIQRIVPEAAISTDMITGFCSETEEEHQDTLSMMDYVQYDHSYMFYYSERPGTLAAKKYEDDVPYDTKKRRLAEIVEKQLGHSHYRNKQTLGKIYKVLVEKVSKKSKDDFLARTSQNKGVIIPRGNYNIGDYVMVKITDCTSASLKGTVITEELIS